MSIKYCKSEDLFKIFRTKIKIIPDQIVVDIGCGIRPQNFIYPKMHVCCEPYDEYVEILLKKKVEEELDNLLVLNLDWEKTLDTFPEKSIDTLFLVDVIEHLPKEDGEKLLKRTLPLVKKQLLIFTPFGFMPQTHPDGKDAWGHNGGDWQEHKSGWLPEDFGKDWEFLISKDFHKVDVHGQKCEPPYGAFWAIYNVGK